MKAYTLKIRGGVERDSMGKKAGKGALIQEEVSATLGVSQDQTLFQPTAAAGESGNNKPCVAYGISSYESYAMKSDNPHSGIYEAKTSRTLDLNGGNPACNQGGVVIVYPKTTGPLMANSHPGSYSGQDAYQDMFVVEKRQALMDAFQHHGWRESETSTTLTAGNSNKVRGDTPLVVQEIVGGCAPETIKE